MGERLVTDEQLEELVSKRLAERKDIINEAVAALEPRLEEMRAEIAAANHIKRTLGRQLTGMERLLRQTATEIRTHGALPFHPAGADIIEGLTGEAQRGQDLLEQFGVEKLNPEQRGALSEVLADHVLEKRQRKQLERRSDRRMTLWLVIGTFLGSIAGAALAAIAVVAYFSQVKLPH